MSIGMNPYLVDPQELRATIGSRDSGFGAGSHGFDAVAVRQSRRLPARVDLRGIPHARRIAWPENNEISTKIRDLREVMRQPGKPAWPACLIQLKRSDIALNIDFEYDKINRWFAAMPDELRPQ
ncbi:hypothetical protein [Nocardia sp. NPDC058497]|uniref:hypothetical protein n=1 Tax=Nocardia sp. NPDC058497 TaxID=3346529 RepID=UPI003646F280